MNSDPKKPPLKGENGALLSYLSKLISFFMVRPHSEQGKSLSSKNGNTGQVTEQVTEQVTGEIKKRVKVCSSELNRSELQLKLKHREQLY